MSRKSYYKNTSCLLCGKGSAKAPLLNKDHISKEVFTFLECPDCLCAYVDVPQDFDVAKYYPQTYYSPLPVASANQRPNAILGFLMRMYRGFRAELVLKHAAVPKGSVVDVGCGRGLMLLDLAEHGWKTYGLEHSLVSSERVRASGRVEVIIGKPLEEAGFHENSLDAITLWHVLEHLKQPQRTLEAAFKLLKPGGIAIVEVPQWHSWQELLWPKRWPYLEAPRHLYQFSRPFLLQMASKIGFEIEACSTFSIEYGVLGMIQSLLNLVSPTPSFLFILMTAQYRKELKQPKPLFFLNLFLLSAFFIPALFLGTLLELCAVALGRGGILKITLRKSR